MTDEVLFPGYDPPPAPSVDDLSAGRRLTLRQAANVAAGVHPLTRGPLHPEASRERTAADGRADPFTCGSCRWRDAYGYPKCVLPGPGGKPWPARMSHGPASDVRAWWPACPDYDPRVDAPTAGDNPGENVGAGR